MIDIVKPMTVELREFQEKTGMCISECQRFFMNVYYVLDIMNKSQEVSGENLEEKPYEKWLKKFQREHDNLKHIGEKEIRDLAAALHDDIPFGYEASMRLSDWLLHIDFGVTGETSDGYHTFNELYHHRAVLFSVIVNNHKDRAWKSKQHHDGSMYDGMFIVGIDTPEGQATYHYDVDPYWGMFKCRELERAPEWDGHTPDDAITRIATLGSDEECECEPVAVDCFDGLLPPFTVHCSACGKEWGYTPRFCPNCQRRVRTKQ